MPEIKGSAIIDTIKSIKKLSGLEAYTKIVELLDGEARQLFKNTNILFLQNGIQLIILYNFLMLI